MASDRALDRLPRIGPMQPSVLRASARTVLGFPAPGDRYWDADTLDAVGQRYSGMDMQPYYRAAGAVVPPMASKAGL